MDLLTSGMLSISAKVNQQGKDIEKNGLRISEQLLAVDANARSIAEIFNRLEDLAANPGGTVPSARAVASPIPQKAHCSEDFLKARRSVRIWPITAKDDEELWAEVGDFIHGKLRIPEMGTFRLLSRFGTRLRARHGDGTKRHNKFDDFNASLYAVIKLPGDEHWTRITSEMARRDLDSSFRQEEEATQKRLALKRIPGPRERLRGSRALPLMNGAGRSQAGGEAQQVGV